MLKSKKLFITIILTNSLLASLKVLVLSQNQGGLVSFLNKNDNIMTRNFEDYKSKLVEKVTNSNADIILYHVQELVELKAMALFAKGKSQGLLNFAGLKNENLNTIPESEFYKEILLELFPNFTIKYNPNISMVTYVLAKNPINFNLKILKAVNNNEFLKKKQFNNGFWGQKGGIISLIEIESENSLFKIISINAHLSSKKARERQMQYSQLLTETKNIIGDLENYTIFFAGDVNSRLTDVEKNTLKSFHDERKSFVKEYRDLVFNLDLEIQQGTSFRNFEEFKSYLFHENVFQMKEMTLGFQPTYKLNFKHDMDCSLEINYDFCYKKKGILKKKPIFGYTDRIFYFSSENQIIEELDPMNDYGIINSKMVSDHFTVFGIFQITEVHPELIRFQNSNILLGKVHIRNEDAIEELKNLFEFLISTDSELKQNFMILVENSNYFFENAINLYNYLSEKTPKKCQNLIENSNNIDLFFQIQNKFINCYEINKNLTYQANLIIEEINSNETNQDEENDFQKKSENIGDEDETINSKNKNINIGKFDQYKKKFNRVKIPPFFNEKLETIENIEIMRQSSYFENYQNLEEVIDNLNDIISNPDIYKEENLIQDEDEQKGFGLQVNPSLVNKRKFIIQLI